jgi:hypothetical protein
MRMCVECGCEPAQEPEDNEQPETEEKKESE